MDTVIYSYATTVLVNQHTGPHVKIGDLIDFFMSERVTEKVIQKKLIPRLNLGPLSNM